MLILTEREREREFISIQARGFVEISLSTFNKLKTVPTSHIRTVSLVQKGTAL